MKPIKQTLGAERGLNGRLGLLLGTAAVLPVLMLSPNAAISQDYPEEDIEFVVPFSSGGGSDILARNIASVIDELDLLPVNLVIENRPGGSGAVGYSYLAQQEGNPNYVGTVSVSFFTTPLLGESPVSYEDFTPLAAIATDPYVMVVRDQSEIQSLEELEGRESLTAGTPGVVSDATLLAGMLDDNFDYEIDVVPYDGSGEVISALLGGHVDVQFVNPSEGLPQIEGGEMRALAVSSAERLESLPDVPTFQELGYDIELAQLRGVVMPNGVPDEAVAYWEDLLQEVAESDAWQEQYLDRFNVEPAFVGSDEFADQIVETSDRYEGMMRELDIIE